MGRGPGPGPQDGLVRTQELKRRRRHPRGGSRGPTPKGCRWATRLSRRPRSRWRASVAHRGYGVREGVFGGGVLAPGIVMTAVVPPPGAGCSPTVPPDACTALATMARPRPLPGRLRAEGERQKRSKTCGSSPDGIPGPSSSIDSRPASRRSETVLPAGENFTALSNRFTTARSSAAGSAQTNQSSISQVNSTSLPRSFTLARAATGSVWQAVQLGLVWLELACGEAAVERQVEGVHLSQSCRAA